MKKPWRVQLVVERELEYFRDVALGARRRAFEAGRLEFADRWLPHELAAGDIAGLVRRDGVRGVVVAAHDAAVEARFRDLGVPAVNISNSVLAPRLPVVTQDDREVGRRAAEHLLGLGARAFVFWGTRGGRFSEERRAGFMETLAAAGVGREAVMTDASRGGDEDAGEYRRMVALMRRLPGPAGAFAVLDNLALALMRAGREAGRRVPEELAVLGAGDDDFFVEFERTPLSSVRLPARRIGYEAAVLLENLIARGAAAARPGRTVFVALPGARVVARRSTEMLGGGDPLVARAVACMRERPAARVAEVARACGVARSGLQRRFLAALGHGMLEERRRLRLARAEALLGETDAKLASVAAEAGYPSAQRLAADLRAAHGCTPGEWRRRAGRRDAVKIPFLRNERVA
jgi:LacI family transcriptional regulator